MKQKNRKKRTPSRHKKRIRFDIITTFPHIFDSYFTESVINRAVKRKLITIRAHNLRDYAKGKHKNVDDKPYGGGAGMVLLAEPLLRAVASILPKKKNKKTKVILLSAKGRQFNQRLAQQWAKGTERLVIISGRYEGIDERVKTILKAEEISIGPYVLTDGDVAAMAVVSSVARLVPSVIRFESLIEESHWNLLLKKEKRSSGNSSSSETTGGSGVEYPHYTRPESIMWPPREGKKYRVPPVLLSGNHKKIEAWRKKHA